MLSVLLLSLWVLPLSTFSISISEINDVFSSVEFIKESIDFKNITISSKVPYDLIQWSIKKYCSSESIEQATLDLEQFKDVWESNRSDLNKYLSNRFDTIKWLISNHKKDNQYKYCKDMYLLFFALKTTQDLYTWETNFKQAKTQEKNLHKNNETSKNTNNQSNNSEYKKINFTFNHDTSGLPNDTKQSYLKSTENYLQETLTSLINSNILNKNDLNILNNKIKVTYKQSCDFTEWTFRIIKDQDSEKYTFKDINLIIAYCDKDSSQNRQKRHTQQILAHELWHYIYFFKDKNSSTFSKICRNDTKATCQPEEFVSDYAQESPEEDYADSFAYRYLDGRNWDYNKQYNNISKTPVRKRFKYFELSFG